MKTFWMSLPLVSLLALGACQFKLEKLTAPDAVSSQTESFSNEQLNYELIRTRVLQPKCLDCHSPAKVISDGVNLEGYDNVMANIQGVKDEVSTGDMPKNDSLSEQQKDLLLRWITLGAPLTSQENPAPKPEPTPTPTPTPPPVPEEQILLDFASVNKIVLGPSCIGCHDEFSMNEKLETYADVKLQLVKIREYVLSGYMPFNAPNRPVKRVLTDDQKHLIVSWIDAGAPEVSNLPVPPVTAPTPPPASAEALDFEAVNKRVITPSCVGCHSNRADGRGNKGGVNLESYAEVFKNIAKVESTIADNSMPRRATLDPQLKALILRWITEGALEKGLPGSVVKAEQNAMTQSMLDFLKSEKGLK